MKDHQHRTNVKQLRTLNTVEVVSSDNHANVNSWDIIKQDHHVELVSPANKHYVFVLVTSLGADETYKLRLLQQFLRRIGSWDIHIIESTDNIPQLLIDQSKRRMYMNRKQLLKSFKQLMAWVYQVSRCLLVRAYKGLNHAANTLANHWNQHLSRENSVMVVTLGVVHNGLVFPESIIFPEDDLGISIYTQGNRITLTTLHYKITGTVPRHLPLFKEDTFIHYNGEHLMIELPYSFMKHINLEQDISFKLVIT